MLRFTTKHTKMHLLLLLFSLIVVAAAAPLCDPETQYVKNGQCCKKCGPGTRMSSTATCDEPQCVDCVDHEYQDSYTNETKCRRQPYCDPNKNFENPVHESKNKRTVCRCKPGFHCSSQECLTCVPHTVCPPGEGATVKGSHLRDTQCKACPSGTFSNESSWDGACQKLTECGDDSNTVQAGTTISDTVCEKKSRISGLGIGIGIAVLAIFAVIAFVAYKVYIKRTQPEEKCKPMNDLKEKEPLTNVDVVTNPTEEEESMIESPIVSTPEENEDEHGSLEESLDVRVTANGHPVKQDTKAEQLSQEETQCV